MAVEEPKQIDTKAAAAALQYLLASGYVNRRQLYLQNFIRGIFFSVGSILGATVVIALILWILSLFDSAPIIGHIIKAIQDVINNPPAK